MRVTLVLLLIMLVGCGLEGSIPGGLGGNNPSPPSVEPPINLPPAVGAPCVPSTNVDALGGLSMEVTQSINPKPHGCLIVNKNEGHPVSSGDESVRFEVRPGDCSRNDSFDDCTNDRTRFEINERNPGITNGKTITYEMKVFIPRQKRFRPKGLPLLVLTQIRYDGNGIFRAIAYLVMTPSNTLAIRVHDGFTWNVASETPVYTSNPFDKWISFKYVIRSSVNSDGYFRVFVDDFLKVDVARATIPDASVSTRLRYGIYNSFVSRASEPFENQIIYFDDIKKTVN